MENLDFISVPVIVTVVAGCLQLLKYAIKSNEKLLKFFPLIAAGLGAVLGLIAFFALPEIIPACNVFLALLIGGSSGLAATGTHQIFKQLITNPKETINKLLGKTEDKKEEDKNDDASGK